MQTLTGQAAFNFTEPTPEKPDYVARSPIEGRLTLSQIAEMLIGKPIVIERTPEVEERRFSQARTMYANDHQRQGRTWDEMVISSLGFAADFALESVPGFSARRGFRNRGFDKTDKDTFLGDGVHDATGTVVEMKWVSDSKEKWSFESWKIPSMLRHIDEYDFLVGNRIDENKDTYVVTPIFVAYAPILWDAKYWRPGPFTRPSTKGNYAYFFDHFDAALAGYAIY